MSIPVKWQTCEVGIAFILVFLQCFRWWLYSINWKSLLYTNAYANAWPASSDGRVNKQLLANTMAWHFNEVITESLAIIFANLRWGVCGLKKRNVHLCFKRRNQTQHLHIQIQKYIIIISTHTCAHTHIHTVACQGEKARQFCSKKKPYHVSQMLFLRNMTRLMTLSRRQRYEIVWLLCSFKFCLAWYWAIKEVHPEIIFSSGGLLSV